jgi:hypothetical protein
MKNSTFGKNFVIGIASLWMAVASTSAHAKLKLENAYFYPESFRTVCTDCGDAGPGVIRNTDLDWRNTYVFGGRIEINQSDLDTGDTRKIVIPNLVLWMRTTGVIAEAGLAPDERMRIKGLGGHPIGDLFASSYEGGKIKVAALANLSAMFVRNGNGIWIDDSESVIAFGVGVELVHVKATFRFDGPRNDRVSVANESPVLVDGRSVSLKDAMGIRL